MSMKAEVLISPKEGILDPQGKTVMDALKKLGFHDVKDVRIGKYIQVKLGGNGNPQEQVRRMCEELLHNPLIETYRFDISED